MTDFDSFYEQNVRLVYAMALGRGLNACAAEDLSQETFLRAWRHFDLLRSLPPPAQRAWLIQTLQNLANDTWRQSRAATEHTIHTDPLSAPAESGSAADWTLRLDVLQALSTLQEIDRDVVVLRYYLQWNSREIGEALQLPESTVRRRLMACRRHLAQQLLAWGPEGANA